MAKKVRVIGARVRRYPHVTADIETWVLERQLLSSKILCRDEDRSCVASESALGNRTPVGVSCGASVHGECFDR